MYFSFKTIPEDFIVKEILNYNLDGVGDFFYVFFEKKGINTMDVINNICKKFNLKRNNLGIAGLKDKDGITQQWLSIHKKYLNHCGGEKIFLSFIKGIEGAITIILTGWHSIPLSVGKNKGNYFTITLKKRETLPDLLKNKLEENLINSLSQGIPNIFGYQRFGKGNKNFKKVLKIFSGEEIPSNDSYEQKFKYQTFGSLWFNEYVMRRRDKKDFLVGGDIMVNGRNAFGTQVSVYNNKRLSHFDYRKGKETQEGKSFREPSNYIRESDYIEGKRFSTGPVLGTELLVCKKGTPGREYDDSIIKESKFLEQGEAILKKIKIYGYRRPLWILPKDLEWNWQDGNLILRFFLPTGCYASSFLAFLLKDIDPKGCESNNLKILRINQNL